MRTLNLSIILVTLATLTQACATVSPTKSNTEAAQEAQAEAESDRMTPERALLITPELDRLQPVVARASGLEFMELLLDPPQRADAGDLIVEFRSMDLSTRYGHGVIRASKARNYGWHEVEWLEAPVLEKNEFYALSLSTPFDSHATWSIALGNRYPWSDVKYVNSMGEATTLGDLGFRIEFDDGSLASAGVRASDSAPEVINDSKRRAVERQPDERPTGFTRDYRRVPANIANQHWVVFTDKDPMEVIDIRNATRTTYAPKKGYEPIDVFGDFALFRKKIERQKKWRDEDWLSIDLRDGTRVEKTISDCQHTKPISFTETAVVACFQDDLLTLHDLPGGAVIETPFLGEVHDDFEILAVGSELHVLGEEHRYAWRTAEDEWRVLGPGASFADPDRGLALFIEELYEKDPKYPGFAGRYFFHESGLRYDLDKRLFSMRVGLTDKFEASRGAVSYGPYVSQEDGQLKLAPRWPAMRAVWSGKSAVAMGPGCRKQGQRCVEGTRYVIWELPASLYEDETLDFRGLDIRTSEP